MAVLRVGIVGASVNGGWARASHVPAIAALSNVELHAVATSGRASAEASAAAFGARQSFVGAAELAASEDVDLMVVAVKAPEHEQAVQAGLMAGKAVLCEWPLGANSMQASGMADLARARGLRGVVGLQGRFSPVAAHARRLIDDGYIGAIQAVTLRAVFSYWGRQMFFAYVAEEKAGVNVLAISGGHCFDMLTYLAGDVADVSGTVTYRNKEGFALDLQKTVPINAPDQFAAQGQLKSGAVFAAHIIGDACASTSFRLDITGTEGQLLLEAPGMPEMAPLSLRGSQGSATPEPLATPADLITLPEDIPNFGGNFAYYYARFENDVESLPTFDDAVKLHRLLDAIRTSSISGVRVKL